MEDYKTFDADPAKHHLVLSLKEATDSAKIETKMSGGETVKEDYVVVDDGFCVYSIQDKDTQKIHVKATKEQKIVEKTYDLSGLTLEPNND